MGEYITKIFDETQTKPIDLLVEEPSLTRVIESIDLTVDESSSTSDIESIDLTVDEPSLTSVIESIDLTIDDDEPSSTSNIESIDLTIDGTSEIDEDFINFTFQPSILDRNLQNSLFNLSNVSKIKCCN